MNNNPVIAASLAIQTAEAQVHLALLERLLQHIDLRELDGVPVQQWIGNRRAVEIERVLLAMGDMNPAAHDAVKAQIVEAKMRTKPPIS